MEMTMPANNSVFISATSADLASYRKAVKDVFLTNRILPVEQTNFPPDFRTVEEMLEATIRDCHAVVILVGFVYGAEPSGQPADRPRRSYTQMEFDIARRLGKPIYQFLAAEDCVFDARPNESAELQALQLAHRKAIETGNIRWEQFSDCDQLRERIAHIQFDRPVPGQVHPLNLPYPSLGTLFKGREAFLQRIREHLLAKSRQNNAAYATRITQPQALCGLGGVGKTRLAVEYGWRYDEEYSATLFVVADSPESLRRNLAQLTGPLVLNLPEQNRQEEEVKMAAAIRWLLEHPGWFLILDNVDNRASVQAVQELLARIPGGHVLITSRIDNWSKDVEPLELDVLSGEDAKSFLLDRTQVRRRVTVDDDADASVLSRELDGLALALEQAGAFIERRRCSLGDYLKRWKAGEARVRQWFDQELMHYPRSVAITYDTTMREVGAVAAALFHLLSWYAPDPLPEGVLENPEAERILTEMTAAAGLSAVEVVPEEALADLSAFSMVKKVDVQGVPCVSQHRLVQEVTQTQMPAAERNASLLGAVRLLNEFAPTDAYRFETWREWRLIVSHAEALWLKVKDMDRNQWDPLLMKGLAHYYLGQGRYREAIPIQKLLLEVYEERLGSVSGKVFEAKNDLALLLNSVGEYAEAQRLYREALAGWKSIDASEYEFGYAESLHNLGFSLMCSGQLEESESTLRNALKLFQEKSGEYHWRTLMTEYSLARALRAKGETENAVQMLLANLEKKANHLPGGENHPDTLDSMMSLARIMLEQGKLSEAEGLAKRAIAGGEQSLGKDDSKTLEAVTLLATIYAKANRPAEAEALMQRLIDAGLRSGDPATLLSYRQAAYSWFTSGEYLKAERMLRGLVEKGFEVAGNRCHLARVLLLTDREQEAREEVAKAWGNCGGAPAYVIPRILWFQIAFAPRQDGEIKINDALIRPLLGQMKTALQSGDAFMEWTMTPVLEHMRSKLAEADYEFLATLVFVLSDRAKMPDLDRFTEWRDQPPVPLEAPLPNV
jgi:tetratricopeptide (TPR) repeat protein